VIEVISQIDSEIIDFLDKIVSREIYEGVWSLFAIVKLLISPSSFRYFLFLSFRNHFLVKSLLKALLKED